MKKTCLTLSLLPLLVLACSDGGPEDPGGECGDPALPGLIRFELANLGVAEDAGAAEIKVQRTVGCLGAASVSYAVVGGTAVEGVDYRLEPGSLAWEDGDAKNRIIEVQILDDDIIEGDRSLELELTIDSGDDELGDPHTLFVTILEDDISGPAPFRVADINTSGTDSSQPWWYMYPEGPPVLDGVTYFAADDGVHGHELWMSDGTPAGTRMVKDIRPGPEGSRPEEILLAFDRIYFHADGPESSGLWKTDGTESGTVPVADPSSEMADPYGRNAAIGPRRFFVRDTGLWTSDGTPAGTSLLREFSSEPDELTVFGSELVFAADDGEHGIELWRSDGTPGGTSLVVDLAPAEGLLRPGAPGGHQRPAALQRG